MTPVEREALLTASAIARQEAGEQLLESIRVDGTVAGFAQRAIAFAAVAQSIETALLRDSLDELRTILASAVVVAATDPARARARAAAEVGRAERADIVAALNDWEAKP